MVSKNQNLILLSIALFLFWGPHKIVGQTVYVQKSHSHSKKSSGSALTFRTVQRRLIGGRYRQNLHAAYWAASQGARVVPFLGRMIDEQYSYDAEDDSEGTAFPLNALWALGHIQTFRSLRVMEKYYERSKDERAGFAIKGFNLRRKMKSKEYGVSISDSKLQTRADPEAEAIQEIARGQEVKILREGIKYVLGSETRTYDYVELLGTRQRGYIQRAADSFTPFI